MNDTHSQSAAQPLYIRVSPGDNVAIVVNQGGLPAGSRFADGLVLVEAVPEAHKVALTDIGRESRSFVTALSSAMQSGPLRAAVGCMRLCSPRPSAPALDELPAGHSNSRAAAAT